MKKLFFIIACITSIVIANDTTEKPQEPQWFMEFNRVDHQLISTGSNKWLSHFVFLPSDVQQIVLKKIEEEHIEAYAERLKKNKSVANRIIVVYAIKSIMNQSKSMYLQDEYKKMAINILCAQLISFADNNFFPGTTIINAINSAKKYYDAQYPK